VTEPTVTHESPLDGIELGTGTWSWGDKRIWGYGQHYGDGDLKGAFDQAIASGIRLFDTAEIYGFGKSERLLGRFARESGATISIATKFFPYPWRVAPSQLPRALRGSLDRLGVDHVDLYQTHWPLPPRSVVTWMEPMAQAVSEGLIKEVGVSNYSADQMRRAFERLAARGVRLASNQVEYSLLKRSVEVNGVLAACRELGVRLIAYSPLAMGMLSGKYTPKSPPPGLRGLRYRSRLLASLQPLIGLLDEIGRGYGNKTRNQVALNWLISKGALPIPGAKSVTHARDNAGAAGWRLSAADVAAIDDASAAFKRP
jgi:aryl-alcohol dehydrogenase-like predicted oxidoreductase